MSEQNMTYQDIIRKMSFLRTQRNISAYDLSLRLGKDKTYIYRVESGAIHLSLEKLLEILEILDVSTFEFFCPSVYQNVQDIELLKSLNEKQVAAVINLLHTKRED